MTTTTTIRVGFVSARLKSPNAQVSNLIQRVVPSSGREFDPISNEWIIAGSRLRGLVSALRAAGVEIVETGRAA